MSESDTPSTQNFSSEEEKENSASGSWSSPSSHSSELSATKLATHSKYAIIWELLHNCQEAAMEDIPERYRLCLSIFEATSEHRGDCKSPSSNTQDYDELFRVAGAIKSSEPWSLPVATRALSEDDALWPINVRVLSVAEVIPMAAVYLAPDLALAEEFQRMTDASVATNASNEIKMALHSASPVAHNKTPAFASAVFTSASQVARDGERLSFDTLRRFSRLATTSLLRQAHSFCVDSPVFGVLLQGSLVAFHVDWYEEHDNLLMLNSAFFVPDEATDLKTWNLQIPSETAEVKAILSNLRDYTAGTYAEQVQRGLKIVNGSPTPWKWHQSSIPEVLTYSRLKQNDDEPSKEKLDRWRESIAGSVDSANHALWLRQKLDVGNEGRKVVHRERRRDFLSPPSTPQLPEDSPATN